MFPDLGQSASPSLASGRFVSTLVLVVSIGSAGLCPLGHANHHSLAQFQAASPSSEGPAGSSASQADHAHSPARGRSEPTHHQSARTPPLSAHEHRHVSWHGSRRAGDQQIDTGRSPLVHAQHGPCCHEAAQPAAVLTKTTKSGPGNAELVKSALTTGHHRTHQNASLRVLADSSRIPAPTSPALPLSTPLLC